MTKVYERICTLISYNIKVEIIVFILVMLVIYSMQLRRHRWASKLSILFGLSLIVLDAIYFEKESELIQNLIFIAGTWFAFSGALELIIISFHEKEKVERLLARQPIAKLHMEEVGKYLLQEKMYPILNSQIPEKIREKFRNKNQKNFTQYIELENSGNTVLCDIYEDVYEEFSNIFLMKIYEVQTQSNAIKIPSAIAVQLRNKFDKKYSKQYNTSIYNFETFNNNFSNTLGSNSSNESVRIFILDNWETYDRRAAEFRQVKEWHQTNNESMYCIDHIKAVNIMQSFSQVQGLDFSINFQDDKPELLLVNNSTNTAPLICKMLFTEDIEGYELSIYFKNQQEKIEQYADFFKTLKTESDKII